MLTDTPKALAIARQDLEGARQATDQAMKEYMQSDEYIHYVVAETEQK